MKGSCTMTNLNWEVMEVFTEEEIIFRKDELELHKSR